MFADFNAKPSDNKPAANNNNNMQQDLMDIFGGGPSPVTTSVPAQNPQPQQNAQTNFIDLGFNFPTNSTQQQQKPVQEFGQQPHAEKPENSDPFS